MMAAAVIGVVGGLAAAWLVWGMCAAASRADELSERVIEELRQKDAEKRRAQEGRG